MTRTLDPQELLEIRKMIWEEVNLQRTCGDDLLPLPPDEVFKYDSAGEYICDAIDALESIKNRGIEDMYVLTLAAATTLIELLEYLRDTGGVE